MAAGITSLPIPSPGITAMRLFAIREEYKVPRVAMAMRSTPGDHVRLQSGRGQSYTPLMLFMVIERFRNADPKPIGQRFKTARRMLPAAITYHASWVDATTMTCFQIMESPNPELLTIWVSHWSDLVDFEIVPVVT